VKRETFRALAEDDAILETAGEVVSALISKDPVVASQAQQALDDRVTARPGRKQPKSETARDEHRDALDLIAKLRTVHRHLADAVILAQNVRGVGADDLRDALTYEVTWIRGVCDVIDAATRGGSMDDRLRELLDAEAGR